MDTCHSGGIARKLSSEILDTPRCVETSRSISPTLDDDLWDSSLDRSGKASIPPGFQYQAMASHVLLAACRQEEFARECLSTEGLACGFFTNSLVKKLGHIPLNQVTYTDLIDVLPTLTHQNPQCEGKNKIRLLFNGRASFTDSKTLALTEANGVYKVQHGIMHGVIEGTKFVVVEKDTNQSHPRILYASSVEIDSSELKALGGKDLTLSAETKVMALDWKNAALKLRVLLSADPESQLSEAVFPPDALRSTTRVQLPSRRYVSENIREVADVAVDYSSDNGLAIERLDAKIPIFADREIRFRSDGVLKVLPDAFDAISHFNFFLGHHHGSDPIGDKVTVEMWRLDGPPWFRMPDVSFGDLFNKDIKNQASFQGKNGAKYGFTICNRSAHDFFPYLFYFDPGSYSIEVRLPSFIVIYLLTKISGMVHSPAEGYASAISCPKRTEPNPTHCWIRGRRWLRLRIRSSGWKIEGHRLPQVVRVYEVC